MIAVLDANVLYPAPVRDLLLNLADMNIYAPKWSYIIHEEWVRNLLLKRPDLKKSKLTKTVKTMNIAFPDAEVHNFEKRIEDLQLPDQDDRHVLAAAIESNADYIITFNTKDFPKKYLMQFNISVITPDEFIKTVYKLNPSDTIQAFKNQLDSLRNPPKTKEELIQTLIKCNIKSAREIYN